MKAVDRDPTFFDPATLHLFCESVVLKDWVKGAALSLRFAESIILPSVIHLVLFPTIFETSEWFPSVMDVNQAMKKTFAISKSIAVSRFVASRRLRDKSVLESVLGDKFVQEPVTVKTLPATRTKATTVKTPAAAGVKKTLPPTKKWTSVADSKGLEKYLNDREAVLAMAREELYSCLLLFS